MLRSLLVVFRPAAPARRSRHGAPLRAPAPSTNQQGCVRIPSWLGIACALAAGAALPLPAAAQAPAADCPASADVAQPQLLGLWRAEFEDGLPGATLLLEKHPQYTDSVRGAINRNGERAQVVGDVEDGGLTLEESSDGRRIAATWLGDFVEGACGREVRGTWQATGDARARRFVLRKQ